ncbi:probable xyloglucan galactosyltransferase GT11 [Carica papaya]|uniref:probable xyloglucan galactosyltransferase GT11 n=1 Tax=Carica papaya TaxID=3649 RepID=UPI000B8CE533|nr:probable xyloglucan galactosyltransferase GT11 [Carica papaya]
MRRHRKGMTMEKAITTKYRTQFWYLALASFLLWIFLLCLYNSSLLVNNSEGDDFTTAIDVSGSRFVKETVNENDLGGKERGEKKKTEDDKGAIIEETTGDKTEDDKIIHEIVEELDREARKEEDVKNGGLENGNQIIVSENERAAKNKTRVSARRKDGGFVNTEAKKEVTARRSRKVPRKRESEGTSVWKKPIKEKTEKRVFDSESSDPCAGKYIYVHEIPSMFNEELLKNCWSLSWWTNMCELTSNLGLGPHIPDLERVPGWFSTNQFTLEVIFHNRMKQYKCLTKDSSMASAIFIPYYAGLDVARFLWGPFPYMRDAAALDLMKWVREKPEWKTMWGRDHFMIAGRTTWDFMRTPENESDWGNRLMILPEPRNMTMLLIESSPWNYHGFGIPYPTYFHPSKDNDVFQWQARMRRQKRRYLFSFVGAPRPNLSDSIRQEIIDQCRASRRKCRLLECVSGSQKCYKADQIMKFFQASTFCLQPPGDSYTRRSTFDSILAGCIPVFFHPGSAYAQYIWHLPKDYSKYSVFIPANIVKEGKASIEKVLHQIPKGKIVAMREEVIRLIPKVIYADPRSRMETIEDAFDITMKGVLDRVEKLRSKMNNGEDPNDFPEEFSWKYNLFGNVEKHEWDSFFART